MAASSSRLKHVFTLLNIKKSYIYSHKFNFGKCIRAYCASGNIKQDERDPGPIFINKNVQDILKKLTTLDLGVVYRPMKYIDQKPVYKFMTNEELKKAQEKAKEEAEKKLQMPPVLKEREPINEVLLSDIRLQGHDTATYVFTDISMGKTDRNRLIVCRDPDGKLRKATWEERDRMNQIYFPNSHKKLWVPKMFESENLKMMFERGDYEYILDKTCLQFEPDSSKFIEITRMTYDHIDHSASYDLLTSTRHFGPMVFYLTFEKKLDNLVLYLLQRNRLDEIVDLVELYRIIHPSCALAQITEIPTDQIEVAKLYLKLESRKRHPLELALQSCIEHRQNLQSHEQTVKEAHGHT